MSFDGVFTHLMVKELKNKLLSGRISKIHQPYENEIILVVRSQGKNQKLLLSANPSYARVQLTNIAYQNPDTAPNFAMMLRKHLEGAILEDIAQVENDRVIHFAFSKRDELGDLQNIILIVELMGRHSTIVLVNKETGKILDAIKHIGFSQNTYRTILPGGEYINPPVQEVKNPFTVSETTVFELLSTAEELTGKYLQSKFQGLGMDTANELAFRLQVSPNDKLNTWKKFWLEITSPTPTLTRGEKKEFFTPIAFDSINGSREVYPTLSELLDAFYGDKAERDRVKQQGGELLHKIENDLKKNRGKLEKLHQTLADTENAETYRRYGELLTTFLTQVPKGAKSVELSNYYDENGAMVTIPLKPALSPSQNAQKYFQKYQKLKIAVKIVKVQIQQTEDEIHYLESVLSQLELATPLDIPVIREELTAEGYLKKRTKGKQRNQKPSKPEKFIATDGTEILVGKNNLQNDQLTLKTAKKTDIWLHAKNIPGSHVIVKSDHPSDETITEAGILAAYYSKYRLSAQVPVDMIQVKHIRKPKGAKPGFVVYEGQRSITVTPDEKIVEKLRNNK